MTNPIADLPRAEANLVRSIDATTAAINGIATHTLDDALARLEIAQQQCRGRMRLVLAQIHAVTGELIRDMDAQADALFAALAWDGDGQDLPAPPALAEPDKVSVPALPVAPDVVPETAPVAPIQEQEATATIAACKPVDQPAPMVPAGPARRPRRKRA